MTVARETVMNALLAKVAASAGFLTVSRRVQLIPGAPTPTVATPPLQPALYLLEGDEETKERGRGLPPVHVWDVDLWVWAKIPVGATIGVPDGTTPGASIINPLLDAVEAALAPAGADLGQGVQTLGGLVSHCWIEGKTVKVPGDIMKDGQCLAIIPVKIMVP